MNYKEEIYKNSLKTIERIYNESMYSKEFDFYRIIDVIHSVNDEQIQTKEWLVTELLPYLCEVDSLKNILICESWYGLLSMIFRYYIATHINIINVDSDEECSKIGQMMQGTVLENTLFIKSNFIEYFKKYNDMFQLIINTNCEQCDKDDLRYIIDHKQKDSIVCMQSSNYKNLQNNINTHESLEDFNKEINLSTIYYSGILNNNLYNSYMVIGK